MSILPLHIEVDKIDKVGWENLIAQFDDASICQTWSYCTLAKRKASTIVVKSGEKILGCCLVMIRRLPFTKVGIAHIKWGPLCMKKGETFTSDVLFYLMRGIKEEYAIKRGCLLKIEPHAIEERKEILKKILQSEGFKINLSERPYRTFKIDLSMSLEDLRKNFSQNCRRNLNKAEKDDLRVIEGTSDELFKTFLMLEKRMWERKNIESSVDTLYYQRIQQDLPDHLKMNIKICYAADQPVCAIVGSAIGDTGEYLLGASGDEALKLNSSYLLQWCMIKWMKENGVRYYDLGAFNLQRNPGGYQFKLGIAGKKGWEETFLGEYYGCFSLTGHIARFLLESVKSIRNVIRKINHK